MKTSRVAYVVVIVGARDGRFQRVEAVFTNEHAAEMCRKQYDRYPHVDGVLRSLYMNDGRVDLSGV